MTYRPPQGDGWQQLADRLLAVEQALRTLQRPTGTSVGSLVDQVQAALANINATVTAAINANSYDKPTIDAKDAATLASAQTYTTNALTAGFTSSGGVNAADLYARNAPGFNITGTRVSGWWESATGRAGTASSSERFKSDIEEVGLDHLRAILGVQVVHFSYTDEIRKRDDPTFDGYVGPDYHVGVNIGAIAEQLHAAGLWELVVYEHEWVVEQRENDDGDMVDVVVGEQLKLDENGEPIPFGIHDILIGYSLLPIVADHDRRLAAIEDHLGLTA